MYTFKCKHEWVNMVVEKNQLVCKINTSPEARPVKVFFCEEELSVISQAKV